MDRSADFQVALLITIGSAAILFLVVAIILFVIFYQKRILQSKLKQQQLEAEYQQKMIQAELESQENERRRLAADLHDSIGAMLSTIRLSLASAIPSAGAVQENLRSTKGLLDETIDAVRKLSRNLLPSTLDKFGLSYAVKEMCDQYAAVSGMPIQCIENGEPHAFDKANEIMIFRIIQELINNAMKHAQANSIEVILNWAESSILVLDDGTGFNPDEKKSGLGLFNMNNRARALQATLNFESNAPNGTKAILTFQSQP